ncbi:lipopolysaccharide kinase InaA family protein [Ruixingdingia sedimenti]|uniref:Lipopolysaccharide kinase InaA family protein n=1 Tax=Ruixingdingia sedimenti TaxID=3073604 RepID=A0ABU1F3W5_9RHOB|nr:lipopolysaccharide kinase InaA family protein [Xinfangfangia sp. LG-4]MDR5651561.1 lipopolysaccharide kinase InaA family protein [Xinfangfangia sp. LG-4]
MSLSHDLAETVSGALGQPPRRVMALTLADGRRFWLKRVEHLRLRLRLQKGDPARAFEAERAGLHLLAARGLPVAEIVLEGPDHIVLADAGPTLAQLAAEPGRDDAATAFAAAGRALARLHRAGLAHGRPAVRDICWDGHTARFIDLERFSPRRRGGFWQGVDLLCLVQSAHARWPDDPRWLNATLAAYAAEAPPGALAAAARLSRRLAPLGTLARLLRPLRPESRELNAVSPTLARLAALDRPPSLSV